MVTPSTFHPPNDSHTRQIQVYSEVTEYQLYAMHITDLFYSPYNNHAAKQYYHHFSGDGGSDMSNDLPKVT